MALLPVTLPRKLILLGCALTLIAAVVAWNRASDRIQQLELSGAALGQSARRVRVAYQEMDGAVEVLKNYLLNLQTRENVPASYADWTQEQQRARDSVALLRRHLADLSALGASPEVANPALLASVAPLLPQALALEQRWFAYDEQGSGLTVHSRAYAISALLPLVATDIKPMLTALRSFSQGEWSGRIALVAADEARARRARLYAGALAMFGLGVATVVLTVRGGYRPRPPAIPLPQMAILPEPELCLLPDFAAVAAGLPRGTARILVVEAAPDLREMLALLVATGGYGVVSCESAAETRAAVQAIRFDLMLIDQHMPGENSLDILAIARRQLPELRVIFVTESPRETSDELRAAHRIAAVLPRRPDPRALLAEISAALADLPAPPAPAHNPEVSQIPVETAAEAMPPAVEEPPAPPPAIVQAAVFEPEVLPAPVPEAVVLTESGSPAGEQPRRAKLKRRPVERPAETPPSPSGAE